MVEQIFKINFIGHSHKLSEKHVGECIISGKYYIGEIEIEELEPGDEKHE